MKLLLWSVSLTLGVHVWMKWIIVWWSYNNFWKKRQMRQSLSSRKKRSMGRSKRISQEQLQCCRTTYPLTLSLYQALSSKHITWSLKPIQAPHPNHPSNHGTTTPQYRHILATRPPSQQTRRPHNLLFNLHGHSLPTRPHSLRTRPNIQCSLAVTSKTRRSWPCGLGHKDFWASIERGWRIECCGADVGD